MSTWQSWRLVIESLVKERNSFPDVQYSQTQREPPHVQTVSYVESEVVAVYGAWFRVLFTRWIILCAPIAGDHTGASPFQNVCPSPASSYLSFARGGVVDVVVGLFLSEEWERTKPSGWTLVIAFSGCRQL